MKKVLLFSFLCFMAPINVSASPWENPLFMLAWTGHEVVKSFYPFHRNAITQVNEQKKGYEAKDGEMNNDWFRTSDVDNYFKEFYDANHELRLWVAAWEGEYIFLKKASWESVLSAYQIYRYANNWGGKTANGYTINEAVMAEQQRHYQGWKNYKDEYQEKVLARMREFEAKLNEVKALGEKAVAEYKSVEEQMKAAHPDSFN